MNVHALGMCVSALSDSHEAVLSLALLQGVFDEAAKLEEEKLL